MRQSSHSGLEIFASDTSSSAPLPYADEGVQAGFPSPAQDYLDQHIDLNRELIRHPASTFYARVRGDSMIDEGVSDGDILIVDRSIEPRNGDMAVCCLDGDFTLKRIRIEPGCVWLVPANEEYDPILVTPDNSFEVWGVVTHAIKTFKRKKF